MNSVRFSVHWKLIEPTKGNYKTDVIDARINYFADKNIDLMLTFEADGPDWACSEVRNGKSCVLNNNNDLAKFVDVFFTRYGSKIKRVQFGNEMLSSSFYAGTAEDYIRAQNKFYGAVKQRSPQTKVVLGGFSTGVVRRYAWCRGDVATPLKQEIPKLSLSKTEIKNRWCNKQWVKNENNNLKKIITNAKYDMLDVHLYDDAEYWYDYISQIMAIKPGVPIIVSEFGGPNNLMTGSFRSFTDKEQMERTTVYFNAISQLPIKEAYYFKLVEPGDGSAHSQSGMLYRGGTNKKPLYELLR